MRRTLIPVYLLAAALLAATLATLACSAPQAGAAVPAAIEVWVTAGDGGEKLHHRPDVHWQSAATSPTLQLHVDDAVAFQTFAGAGAALTDASAWVISQMPEPARTGLMTELFSPTAGIGVGYLRLPIGASDFTPDAGVTGFPVLYSYADDGLFSLARDDAAHYNRIPLLRQARAINPGLELLGSPWTAPAWMKDSGSPNGGSLLPEQVAAYAGYLVSFTLAYKAERLPIAAVTVQNEPLHESSLLPSMRMTSGEQAAFVAQHLGPAFARAGVDADILIYDHNWDRVDYPLAVLGDAAARLYIAGTAWHGYAGSVDAQSVVHDAYPDVDTHLTECTGHYRYGDGQEPDDNFREDLVWEVQNLVIGATRDWASTVLLWNLALDPEGGPHLPGACGEQEGTRCRGLVTVGPGGAIARHVEYYVIGHLSKFVRPGARRIASSHLAGTLESVAFKNLDGSIALVVLNPQDSAQSFEVTWGDRGFPYTLPGHSVATFEWPPVRQAYLPLWLGRSLP